MLAKLRFLIIDDSKPVLAVYTELLQHAGHEVTAFSSCDQALDHIIRHQPDCVLCDLILPGMDGLELLRNIRKEKLVPEALVIMLTNESASTRIEEAKSLQVSGYIVKATSLPSEVVEEIIKIADAHIK